MIVEKPAGRFIKSKPSPLVPPISSTLQGGDRGLNIISDD